jgi:Fe-S cluster assembly ATP-binding protein
VLVDQKLIISAMNLEIEPGQIHVLMGPNGSGKSSLAHTLMGHPGYSITQGAIIFEGIDIASLSIDKRAQAGIFLAFQHPIEIPGLTVFNFLKEAYFAITKKMLSVKEFEQLVFEAMDVLHMDHSFAYRSLHTGFSGGEKKRLEVLQLLILKPKIAILDEIDSGLDVDAIKIVAHGLIMAKKTNPELSLILITHYPRLLSYMTPDYVHVMQNGTIVERGGASLAGRIEQEGYHAIDS